jgi:AcrR family transcriptional regulator
VLAAAKAEFAAHGFAGASVDRIAAAARLNKAMIYYHFRSKAALYREILRDMFAAAGSRIRNVAASSLPPDDKIRAFVSAIATEADARPHFPPIWFREIADGGAHLDEATLGEIAGIVGALAGFITEGVRAGRFRPIDPLLVHAGIVGPLLLFFASAALRARMEKAGMSVTSFHDRTSLVAHVERVALGVLEGRMGEDRQRPRTAGRVKPQAAIRGKPGVTVRRQPDAAGPRPDAPRAGSPRRRTGTR